jgi:glycosyltransferase involved in cell wall biosynthesis
VAAESLAVGKPVVASWVGGLPEIVEHEATGILVPPDEPQALAAAVCRILGDAGFTARAAARGRKAIRLSFTATGVLGQYRQLYREMLAGC